jgi:hypothetical protein
MSFLKEPVDGANPGAAGLGHLLGADPSRVSSIADRIGQGMNGIAQAGGATPGYASPDQSVNNHLQLLDPEVLRSIIAKFRPSPTMGVYQ